MDQINAEDLKSRGENLLNGLLYKFQISQGYGEHPTKSCEVVVELKMFVKSQVVVEYTQHPYKNILRRILPPGLSFAILNMKQNEKALIWVDPTLAFGTEAFAQFKISKNTPVIFEVFLKSFSAEPKYLTISEKLDPSFLKSFQERIDLADSMIQEGKKFQALKRLRNNLLEARIDAEKAPEQQKMRNELVFVMTVKTAECALDMGWYPLAISMSKEALQIKKDDAKTNFICACAYFALGHNESARHHIRSAHHHDLSNEVYERKKREIDQHILLLDTDVTYDSDAEEFEAYAELLLQKIQSKEDKLKKKVSSFINEQFQQKTRFAVVGNGFRPAFLKKISDKLASSSQFRASVTHDSLHICY